MLMPFPTDPTELEALAAAFSARRAATFPPARHVLPRSGINWIVGEVHDVAEVIASGRFWGQSEAFCAASEHVRSVLLACEDALRRSEGEAP
jgi:hypothetical protein